MRRTIARTIPVGLLSLALITSGLALGAAPASAQDSGITTTTVLADPTEGLPSDWISRGSGQFGTADPQDLLEYRVDLGAVPANVVEFRLEAHKRCIWWKKLVMPDGLGSEWNIPINPAQGLFANGDGLWAGQVHNGQRLELWKAGFLGSPYPVLYIGDLGAIQPGTRVVFTWLRDSATC